MFENIIIELLVEETKLHNDEVENLLETPPRLEMGDFSFPCFRFTNPEKDDLMWKDVEHDFFKRKNVHHSHHTNMLFLLHVLDHV